MSERWYFQSSPMIFGYMASAYCDPGELQEPPNVLAGQSPYRTNCRHSFHEAFRISLGLVPSRVDNGYFRAWHTSPVVIALSSREQVVRIQYGNHARIIHV